MSRIDKIREILKDRSLEGALFYKPENRYYLSGFKGSTGFVLITATEQFFITDFRYVNQAKEQCPDFALEVIGYERTLEDVLNEKVSGKIGFEDDFMTVEIYEKMKEKLQGQLIPLKRAIEELRIIKDETEIETIQQAASIADQVFDWLIGYIKPGMKEKDVYHAMLTKMRSLGASDESFAAIVASGVRGALPHGLASDKVIEAGELVTLDFGCIYEGYCSDMTRTICMGRANDRQKEIYFTVLEAQEKALAAIKPGMTGEELDKIARDYITEKGYGENFGHGLGHGVGLEVHESPRLAPKADRKLEAGMVVTDEPGIYIEGFGGVRIEDLIVVTEDGCRLLSQSPKELIEIAIEEEI